MTSVWSLRYNNNLSYHGGMQLTEVRKFSCEILIDLAKSVRKEGLLLLPNPRAMVRMDRLGVIDHLVQVSQKNDDVQIKIICPLSVLGNWRWSSTKAGSITVTHVQRNITGE
jgi:hypothetical protein